MDKLSQILWRERELLDTLLYRLEIEQVVLATGRTRWLSRAAQDVETVLDVLRRTELVRATAADEAAASIGLVANPSLRALAEAVDEPWHSILLDHRTAFEVVSREITTLAETNRDLLTSGLRSARETLLSIEHDDAGYGQDGGMVVAAAAPRLVDRSL